MDESGGERTFKMSIKIISFALFLYLNDFYRRFLYYFYKKITLVYEIFFIFCKQKPWDKIILWKHQVAIPFYQVSFTARSIKNRSLFNFVCTYFLVNNISWAQSEMWVANFNVTGKLAVNLQEIARASKFQIAKMARTFSILSK